MNKNGETPTHLLASARTSSPLVLAYLLQHDANVNITNRYVAKLYKMIKPTSIMFASARALCTHSLRVSTP